MQAFISLEQTALYLLKFVHEASGEFKYFAICVVKSLGENLVDNPVLAYI